MHQQIQTFLSENMIILLYSRYDELKLLIILAFYQLPTKQLIIAFRTQQLGWRKLPDIWINRVALRWISAISLRTFQLFNGYFLRANPQVKQFLGIRTVFGGRFNSDYKLLFYSKIILRCFLLTLHIYRKENHKHNLKNTETCVESIFFCKHVYSMIVSSLP